VHSVRLVLVTALLLAPSIPGLSPAPAAAAPVAHLAWDDCGASGHLTRSFACDTNVGAEQLVVSFVPPAVAAFTGIEARIRFWPPAASLPAWWALSTGGCRAGSLRASPFAAGPSSCTSPWTSQVFWTAQLDLSTQEIKVLVDLNKGQEHGLDGGTEYYGVRIAFDHARSTGAGACGGCSLPAGLYLSRLALLLGPPDPTYEFALAEVPYVNWQCDGAPIVTAEGVTGWTFPDCATPARAPTWGRIKALYR
jgi:hypothetical protein